MSEKPKISINILVGMILEKFGAKININVITENAPNINVTLS